MDEGEGAEESDGDGGEHGDYWYRWRRISMGGI